MEWITILLNQFTTPQGTNPDLYLRGYIFVIDGLPTKAIVATCQKYMRGEIDGQDTRFAPTAPAFAKTVRREMARMEYEARPKLAEPPKDRAPDKRVAPEKMALLRAFWRKDITFDQLLVGCGMKQQEG